MSDERTADQEPPEAAVNENAQNEPQPIPIVNNTRQENVTPAPQPAAFQERRSRTTQVSSSARMWFHHSIGIESVNGDHIYGSLKRFRDSQMGLLKRRFLEVYSIIFSHRYRCIIQYMFIVYAIINICACLFVKSLMRTDIFGLKFLNFTLKAADLSMYLSIDMQDPPVKFNQRIKPRSIPWKEQKCFDFFAFEDNELLPLIFSGSLWSINTKQTYKPVNNVLNPPDSMYIIMNFNPFCYRLHHPVLRFIFKYYIGLYPLINNEISKYLNFKPINKYEPLFFNSNSFFLKFFINLFNLFLYGAFVSFARNCLSVLYVDFFTFANILDVNRSSKMLILMTCWLMILSFVVILPLCIYSSILDFGIAVNHLIGEIFTTLLLNRATQIFWSQIFHLVNFVMFLIIMFNPNFHIRLAFMASHSILFAVGFFLVNELNLPFLANMTRFGIFRN